MAGVDVCERGASTKDNRSERPNGHRR